MRAPESSGPHDKALHSKTHGDKQPHTSYEVCALRQPMMSQYPDACKERAVKLAVESEQPIAQTARDLGVHANT